VRPGCGGEEDQGFCVLKGGCSLKCGAWGRLTGVSRGGITINHFGHFFMTIRQPDRKDTLKIWESGGGSNVAKLAGEDHQKDLKGTQYPEETEKGAGELKGVSGDFNGCPTEVEIKGKKGMSGEEDSKTTWNQPTTRHTGKT